MTNLTMGVLAAAILLGGCASTEPQGRLWESPLPKEAFVLGSKLPRSESMENFQGTKSISVQDYRQYKLETIGEPQMR